MNTKNIEFLQDGLKYLGFDTKLGLEMMREIQAGKTEFTLAANVRHFKDDMNATIHFKKSATNDMYFLNKYDASLAKEDGSRLDQTFYINKNAGITFKEAYNLLSGRAVNKTLQNREGEKYNAWVQLDFDQKDKHDNHKVKQFNANYGYDLATALSKHDIKEMNDPEQREKLVRSLSKGNLQSVTSVKDGREERMFVEANPQFKTVNLYDGQMKKQYQENTVKSELAEAPVKAEKAKTKSVAKSPQEGQLQKKRVAKKKGMGI